MSWVMNFETVVPPRQDGHREFGEHLDKAVADAIATAEREVEVPAAQLHGMREQINAAASASNHAFRRLRTTYSTGCKVYTNIVGHTGNDMLNFEPHHINIQISIVPTPYHR